LSNLVCGRVIATQNPVESHGVYPLPEAQLDRFAMKLRIGYPDRASELEMLAANASAGDRGGPAVVLQPEELARLQDDVARLPLSDDVREYLVDLGRATREHRDAPLGLSPRGLLTWQRVSQARAYVEGRDFVTPDDIQHVARGVLGVRLGGDDEAAGRIVQEVLDTVAVPIYPKER
jgi:MoxR-like ATPase